MGQKQTGRVLWFNKAKGYGFIQPDGSADDVFVHYSGIDAEGYRELQPDQRVSFEIIMAPKGRQAINVRVAG
jgi:CspA family cold shock protein